jgi:hypothetical protein
MNIIKISLHKSPPKDNKCLSPIYKQLIGKFDTNRNHNTHNTPFPKPNRNHNRQDASITPSDENFDNLIITRDDTEQKPSIDTSIPQNQPTGGLDTQKFFEDLRNKSRDDEDYLSFDLSDNENSKDYGLGHSRLTLDRKNYDREFCRQNDRDIGQNEADIGGRDGKNTEVGKNVYFGGKLKGGGGGVGSRGGLGAVRKEKSVSLFGMGRGSVKSVSPGVMGLKDYGRPLTSRSGINIRNDSEKKKAGGRKESMKGILSQNANGSFGQLLGGKKSSRRDLGAAEKVCNKGEIKDLKVATIDREKASPKPAQKIVRKQKKVGLTRNSVVFCRKSMKSSSRKKLFNNADLKTDFPEQFPVNNINIKNLNIFQNKQIDKKIPKSSRLKSQSKSPLRHPPASDYGQKFNKLIT